MTPLSFCCDQILDGRVAVNGKRVTTLGERMDIVRDILSVDGKKVVSPKAQKAHWVVINKPKSVLTTMKDEKNRDTVLSLVPNADELRLVPVGGMDRDDTGLLLLTNEVDWIHPLTHPSKPHVQRYEVAAAGIPTERALIAVNEESGQSHKGNSGAVRVELLDVDPRQRMSRLSVALDQRRAGQLGDVVGRLGCTLVSSKRVEYAGIRLKGLRRGQWRELSPGEVAVLKASVSKQRPGREDAPTGHSPEPRRPKKPISTPLTAAKKRPAWSTAGLVEKGGVAVESREKSARKGASTEQSRKWKKDRSRRSGHRG